ncbi:nucleotidyltransferase [Listeria ilorinensis]|uniref:nucleotidyltransferase n=1 Tax=Listeria ilorinensis TaxID=2867439 RepID=UPI001EF61666|nr:nucleotidyltransferase [Listeria ilorinensis]
MKAVGIVVEYNPFHNGHLYHLERARQDTGADVVVAIMSGSFVQRGEPAILSKHARTKMALSAGVDLVVELPVRFAVQQADIFAREAVRLLGDLQVDTLYFGSEDGQVTRFEELTNWAISEAFTIKLKELLADKKNSYGTAYMEALRHAGQNQPLDLTLPNNILGFHYALAVRELGLSMKLATLRRQTDYHEERPTDAKLTSATAIRKMILKDDFAELEPYVPTAVFQDLTTYDARFLAFDDMWAPLRYRLLTDSPNELAKMNSITEGIENRMVKTALEVDSADEFLQLMTTKRYSTSRIKRAAVQLVLHHLKDEQQTPYHHILGMTRAGQHYLSSVKKELNFPLVSTISKAPAEVVAADIRATRIYALLEGGKLDMNEDFRRPLLLY